MTVTPPQNPSIGIPISLSTISDDADTAFTLSTDNVESQIAKKQNSMPVFQHREMSSSQRLRKSHKSSLSPRLLSESLPSTSDDISTAMNHEPDGLPNLKNLKQFLCRHLHQNQETLSLENMQSLLWPRAVGDKFRQKTEGSAQYLKEFYSFLLILNKQLYQHCTEASWTLMNVIVIAELREAIIQTARIGKDGHGGYIWWCVSRCCCWESEIFGSRESLFAFALVRSRRAAVLAAILSELVRYLADLPMVKYGDPRASIENEMRNRKSEIGIRAKKT